MWTQSVSFMWWSVTIHVRCQGCRSYSNRCGWNRKWWSQREGVDDGVPWGNYLGNEWYGRESEWGGGRNVSTSVRGMHWFHDECWKWSVLSVEKPGDKCAKQRIKCMFEDHIKLMRFILIKNLSSSVSVWIRQRFTGIYRDEPCCRLIWISTRFR